MIQSELIVGSHQRVQSPCCPREGGQQVQERGAVCAHYVLACEACGARAQAGRAAGAGRVAAAWRAAQTKGGF